MRKRLKGKAATPKAKAKKRPQWALQGNARAAERRAVLKVLNGLAAEFSLGTDALDGKAVDANLLAKHLRLLNRRCTNEPSRSTFAAAVRQWVANGGKLPDGMSLGEGAAPAAAVLTVPDDDPPSAGDPTLPPRALLPRHKVLQSAFRLQSKAFMLTHNSRTFTKEMWPEYKLWVQSVARKFGATAWSACWEMSEHAKAAGNQTVFHGHAYFLWEDGVGVRLQDLTPLEFKDSKPQVDRCVQPAGKSLRTAALHGLWYVAVMKSGTVFAESNFKPGKDYQPLSIWLTGLWDAGKLSHERYVDLSSQFRTGHAQRRHDTMAVQRAEREQGIMDHVRTELASLSEGAGLTKFHTFTQVEEFVQSFTKKLWRRAILVIVGGTNLGKSLLAADVLGRLATLLGVKGFLEVTVEGDDALDSRGTSKQWSPLYFFGPQQNCLGWWALGPV